MTENEIPESCTTKAKHFWKDFYSSPCFLLKVISFIVILGLAIFGLCKIVTSAFYYFDEPLSYFDPERLGQLGDFLGGTLNPIFGFATVCLLLWSVFIQRKELSLTREELTKSATALNNQVRLATDEYNRKQIEDELEAIEQKYQECLKKPFPQTEYREYIDGIAIPNIKQTTTLIRIVYLASEKPQQTKTTIFEVATIDPSRLILKNEIEEIVKYKTELKMEIIKLTNLPLVKNKTIKEARAFLNLCRRSGLVTEALENELTTLLTDQA
jgi:hypothetical protein